jgi:hypothetical protein
MGAYNFQPQFEQPIIIGAKRHTIRAPRRNEDRPGKTFYGFLGMRTSACRKIIQAPYIKNEQIVIEPPSGLIEVAGIKLAKDEREALAIADGFPSLLVMMQFWRKVKLFQGLIHHWDFERRVNL